MQTSKHVSYEQRGKVALLTMDDGKANALGFELMEGLHEALTRAEREASAVVLTGRAGRFSAGFDMAQMMAGPAQAKAIVAHGAELLLRLYALPMPLVIACTGHALAGGALMALTGDVRVAARGAFKVGLNEVQIGLPVPILAMEFARDRLAPQHLTAATLFARVTDPDEARLVGYLDEVVEVVDLLPTALRRAEELTALPREPYAKTKAALREKTIAYIRSTLESDLARLTGG